MNCWTRLAGVVAVALFAGVLAPPAIALEPRMVLVGKDVVYSRSNPDGSFTVAYDVTVTGWGSAPSTYDLVDEPRFGADVTVDAGSAIDLSGDTFNIWDGITETTVVTGRNIEPGASHVYRITVTATPGPATTGTATDCALDEGETGTGFLNTAMVTGTAVTATADACTPIPGLALTKVVLPGSPEPNGFGTYIVGYRIDVTNPGATLVTYDLNDATNFGTGISVDMAWVENTAPGTVFTDPNWNGGSITSVASGVDIEPGATHSYLVVVLSTVDPTAPGTARDCTLDPRESGTGFLGTATLFADDRTLRAETCVEVPDSGLGEALRRDLRLHVMPDLDGRADGGDEALGIGVESDEAVHPVQPRPGRGH